MKENYKGFSLSGLPLKTGLRKFFKQKGNGKRRNIRLLGKEKKGKNRGIRGKSQFERL